jgi:MFS family permease
MSEALGLLLGSTVGGWLYQHVSATSPFAFEAACMLVAAGAVRWCVPHTTPVRRAAPVIGRRDWRLLRSIVRTRGVPLMSLTNVSLTAIQTGALVFLFPLYLAERGRLRPENVGYLVGISVLGRLVALWLVGSVSERTDRLRLLVAVSWPMVRCSAASPS